MKSLLTLTLGALLLAGCASSPPTPEWQNQAFTALNRYTTAYLNGNNRVAYLEFEQAKAEIARTGRPDLMVRIALLRCATQVASLVLTPCEAYQALAPDAPPEEQAYASFISGQWHGLEVARLPQQYQPVVRKRQAQVGKNDGTPPLAALPSHSELHQIQDPLARLIAAGALIQKEPLTAVDMDLAVETASSQGWRRPLLAWLGVQLKHLQTTGETVAAAKVQRRIALVLQNH